MRKSNTSFFAALLLCIFCMIACNKESKNKVGTKQEQTTRQTSSQVAPPPPPNAANFDTTGFISTDIPTISNDLLQAAYDKANLMDIIFYNIPMSINQSNPAQIKSSLGLISPNKPKFKGTCTSLGRMFFYNGAETLLEAEIYYGGTCYYYKFLNKKGKVIGNNNMNMQGVNFFGNIIKQGETQLQGR